MRIRSRQLVIALVLVAFTAASVSAVSAHSQTSQPKMPVSTLLKAKRFVNHPVTTVIKGGSPALDSAIDRVLTGMDGSRVRSVTVGKPPAHASASDPGEAIPKGAGWLYLNVFEPNPSLGIPGGIEGYWEANIVAGAVHDISAAQGLLVIAGETITGVHANGTPTGHVYSVRLDSRTAARKGAAIENWTPARLIAEIRATAAKSGLSLGSVRVQQPLGLAVTINVTLRNGSTAATSRAIRLLGGGYSTYEGVFIQVRNRSGTVLGTFGIATRTGALTALGLNLSNVAATTKGSSCCSTAYLPFMVGS